MPYYGVALFLIEAMSKTVFIKRDPSSLIPDIGKKLRKAKEKLTGSSSADTSDYNPLYERLIDESSASVDQRTGEEVHEETSVSQSITGVYRRRTFPCPDYAPDDVVQEFRMLDMDGPNRLILFSKLLKDLSKVPSVDLELIKWEDEIANGGDFWAELPLYGVIPWYGQANKFKLSALSAKKSESARLGRDGLDAFYTDFINRRLAKWPKLREPEYKYLQDYYRKLSKEAKKRQAGVIDESTLKGVLELPYDILHSFQLTYRNMAVDYIHIEAELDNIQAGRPKRYVPEGYRTSPSSTV